MTGRFTCEAIHIINQEGARKTAMVKMPFGCARATAIHRTTNTAAHFMLFNTDRTDRSSTNSMKIEITPGTSAIVSKLGYRGPKTIKSQGHDVTETQATAPQVSKRNSFLNNLQKSEYALKGNRNATSTEFTTLIEAVTEIPIEDATRATRTCHAEG